MQKIKRGAPPLVLNPKLSGRAFNTDGGEHKQRKTFWRDDEGGAEFISLILITAVVAMGGLVGLAQIRDQVVQEFGDVAVALDNVDQSFSYTISIDTDRNGSLETTISASYVDDAATLLDPANAAPACLTLNVVSPTTEGGALTAPTGAFP